MIKSPLMHDSRDDFFISFIFYFSFETRLHQKKHWLTTSARCVLPDGRSNNEKMIFSQTFITERRERREKNERKLSLSDGKIARMFCDVMNCGVEIHMRTFLLFA